MQREFQRKEIKGQHEWRWLIAAVVLAALAAAFFNRAALKASAEDYFRRRTLPEAQTFTGAGERKTAQIAVPSKTVVPTVASIINGVKNLAVPFISQAPHAEWDHLHDEACEEASLIMVDAYYKGKKAISKLEAEEAIQAVVAWEKKRFGYFEGTTAEETAIIAREYFGRKGTRVVAASKEAILKELGHGRPVIIPAAGRVLGNPYFRGAGPDYHMLVIKGYANGKFIVNDPGTRRGEDFLYNEDVLLNAIHDWVPGNVLAGAPVMIVVE